MNFLEKKILEDGNIKQGNILKVDNFLNHQIDIDIMRQIAYEFKRRFKGLEVNKILTIEASGIAIATLLADLYDVPVVFAKKSQTANSTDDKYVSHAYSFTHKSMNQVFVSRPYLSATDKVLIVDDFLADGEASHALIDIVHQAGGEVVGIGIAIEKGQQEGGRKLREEGYRLESIAIIDSMDFRHPVHSFPRAVTASIFRTKPNINE
jgi:xanthine phosphoribosyltransferase